MSDPKVIYLAPACEAESGEGRTWAEDNPWPDCDCGHRPVMYVIGETFSRMKAERDALQQRLTAADERADVLEGLLREFQKSARKQDWASGYPTLFASVDAALKPAAGGGDD
ncbi:hypothetical protein [Pseudomonas poae]|uniref:hypothetical protein n=1 Tax=Pseudomonas poae TaxID=200451 RepID=UPI0030D59C9B